MNSSTAINQDPPNTIVDEKIQTWVHSLIEECTKDYLESTDLSTKVNAFERRLFKNYSLASSKPTHLLAKSKGACLVLHLMILSYR